MIQKQSILMLFLFTMGFPQKINLNSATIEELHPLNLTHNQIESILFSKDYIRPLFLLREAQQIPTRI